MKFRLITLFATLALSFAAFALDLQSAKDQGLVGEQTNGYLAALKSTADVTALVNDVNAKRTAAYQQIAQKNGISADDVAKLAAKKIIAKAEKGHMVQDSSGSWVKK
ncbi:YdbL family protein [Shewanella avicenniae]|uniref:YdbL family protein n=1 Tax=Shewanella avicenniae TaxID=2814294 RepID=A0ABX7QVI8_9GAMM|nr:YdbL family protein [Shewanella avicenniae]QSX34990.1 YdbL family protein [Shewanella avicenniae]